MSFPRAFVTLTIGAACAPASAPALTPAPASCFLLYEMGRGEVLPSRSPACEARVSPASTFKIPHALAALDSGVLSGADTTFRYDGAPVRFPAWAHDHTLASAIRNSVVWYFQRVATELGPNREAAYLRRLDYGNADSSSGLTTFWLDGSLRISPAEQEKFLVHLYDGSLPVRPEALATVRAILVQPPNVVVNATGVHPFAAPWPEGTTVSAKTGSGDHERWLVGHVARGPRSWVFVSCVQGDDLPPEAAIDLAARSLHSAAVL